MITHEPQEIKDLKEGGKILAIILNMVASKVRAGVSAFELDQLAETEIIKAGGKPSFKNYRAQPGDPPFPATLCVSLNNEVVHGIPTKEKILKDGDVVGLDIGMVYKGLYTDMAVTVPVGKVADKYLKLIQAATEALEAGLSQIKPGNFTGDVGFAIESVAKQYGFSSVRELVGHGVGKSVHESPEVPGFGKKGSGTKLMTGMVLAVEPMLNEGGWKVSFKPDGWTIVTEDGSYSAHMENTIIVTQNGYEVVTQA
jgi:methionyl aminopeptidase